MLITQAAVTLLRKVLENQTWADGRVAEQPVDPVREVLDGQTDEENQRPYIAVYVENASSDVIGHDQTGQFTEATIKISIIVGPGIIRVNDDYIAQLDSKTAGMAVNMVGRQVYNAMRSGNSQWVSLWHQLCRDIKKISSRFMLVEIEDPVRVPCLEITMVAQLLPEPTIGAPMTKFWQAFTAAITADGGQDLAQTLQDLIEKPDGLPSYALLQSQMGYTDAALAATGIAPLDADSVDPETGEPPLLQSVNLVDDTSE